MTRTTMQLVLKANSNARLCRATAKTLREGGRPMVAAVLEAQAHVYDALDRGDVDAARWYLTQMGGAVANALGEPEPQAPSGHYRRVYR